MYTNVVHKTLCHVYKFSLKTFTIIDASIIIFATDRSQATKLKTSANVGDICGEHESCS